MSAARAAVLARIRAALGPAPAAPEVERSYAASRRDTAGLADSFCERVEGYRATVHRCAEDEAGAVLAAVCGERGCRRLAVAPGVTGTPDGFELLRDDPPLDLAALDGVDGVITGCALAIAETGTLVLDGASASGRRALTLVPDLHVCLVGEEQIVAGVPEAIAALREAAGDGRPITFVSGPSATSDIEFERIEGVHGPRTLDVVVVARRG